MNSKRRWFKIWAIGNGGMECFMRYVYWNDHSDDNSDSDMSYMIEREIGPFSSGVRSVHWRRVKPPKKVIEDKIRELRRLRKSALNEIREHVKSQIKK